MGSWLAEALCLEHEVGVYDSDKKKLRFLFNTHRFINIQEIKNFNPDIVINAVSLQYTIDAYELVLPYLNENCILSDIASVKNGIKDYYKKIGRRFVSTHPMFGPTFANIKNLTEENAIIIKESDEVGKKFFYDFYNSLKLNIYEYTFEEHDQKIAISLSLPFATSLVFGICVKKQKAPGTTYKKHMNIIKGLMTENNYLISEVLFSPYSLEKITLMKEKLQELEEIIKNKDTKSLHKLIDFIRKNIE